MKQLLFLSILISLSGCGTPSVGKRELARATVSYGNLPLNFITDVKTVIRGWNRRLEFDYFRTTSSSGNIIIRTSNKNEDFLDDEAVVGVFRGSLGEGLIYVRSDLAVGSALQTVLYHELGHALNLEHNSDPRSIMFPSTVPGVEPSRQDVELAKRELLRSQSTFSLLEEQNSP